MSLTRKRLKNSPTLARLLAEQGYRVDPADEALEYLTVGDASANQRAGRTVGFQTVRDQTLPPDWDEWKADHAFLGSRVVAAVDAIEHGKAAREIAAKHDAQCYLAPQGLYTGNAPSRSHLYAKEHLRLMVDIDAPGVFETLLPDWIKAGLIPHVLLVTGVFPDLRVQAIFRLTGAHDAALDDIRRAQQELCGIDAGAEIMTGAIRPGGDPAATSARQLGRVPWSENIATEKKRAKGYSPRFTVVPLVRKEAAPAYSLADITRLSAALYPADVTVEALHGKIRSRSVKVDRSAWETPSEPEPYYVADHKQRIFSAMEQAPEGERYATIQREVFQAGSLCCYGYDEPEELLDACRKAAAGYLADEPIKAEELISSTFEVGMEHRCEKIDDHRAAVQEIAAAVADFQTEAPHNGLAPIVRENVSRDIERILAADGVQQSRSLFGAVARWVRQIRDGKTSERFVYLTSLAIADKIDLAGQYDERGWRRGPGGARKLISDAVDRGLGMIDWGAAA